MRVLEKLIDLVFPPRADENLVRNAHPFDVAALVAPNLISVGTHTVTTLLPFSNPLVRALIHEAKYHKNRRAFSLLGDMLGEYFTEKSAEEGWGTIRIVPVPLSQKGARIQPGGGDPPTRLSPAGRNRILCSRTPARYSLTNNAFREGAVGKYARRLRRRAPSQFRFHLYHS